MGKAKGERGRKFGVNLRAEEEEACSSQHLEEVLWVEKLREKNRQIKKA
ncbi:MAG: hypothetical protein MI674_03080 [Cytophagales bacterium]|nr:hypothetical protein [Cytophagales bacterium]